MTDNTNSKCLYRRANFLATLSATAKELGEEVEALADAVQAVEDAKGELADVLTHDDATPNDVHGIRTWLAQREARLVTQTAKVDVLEARLRNFKDDVEGCLGVELTVYLTK
jgi:DNA repair ATPase RecN